VRIKSLAVIVQLLLFRVHNIGRCIAQKVGETSSVLGHPVLSHLDVAELLSFGLHDTLGNVILSECFGELFPRDVGRVLMGVIETVPLGTCCTYELVCGSSNTLIVGEHSEIKLLLHFLKPVIGYQRVRVGAIIGRCP
jgi:hypothetical protein